MGDRHTVDAGTTLSEPTLWVQWQHQGTLISMMDCSLLTLCADTFRAMVREHLPALISCSLYAQRLIKGMDNAGCRCTDIVVPRNVISNDDVFLGLLRWAKTMSGRIGSCLLE